MILSFFGNTLQGDSMCLIVSIKNHAKKCPLCCLITLFRNNNEKFQIPYYFLALCGKFMGDRSHFFALTRFQSDTSETTKNFKSILMRFLTFEK